MTRTEHEVPILQYFLFQRMLFETSNTLATTVNIIRGGHASLQKPISPKVQPNCSANCYMAVTLHFSKDYFIQHA